MINGRPTVQIVVSVTCGGGARFFDYIEDGRSKRLRNSVPLYQDKYLHLP